MDEGRCPGHDCLALCTPASCACPPCYCTRRVLRDANLKAILKDCDLALAARRQVIARKVKRPDLVPLRLFVTDPQPQEPRRV